MNSDPQWLCVNQTPKVTPGRSQSPPGLDRLLLNSESVKRRGRLSPPSFPPSFFPLAEEEAQEEEEQEVEEERRGKRVVTSATLRNSDSLVILLRKVL